MELSTHQLGAITMRGLYDNMSLACGLFNVIRGPRAPDAFESFFFLRKLMIVEDDVCKTDVKLKT